jgi:hypothetical protein
MDSLDATGSFSDAEDSEVSAALNRRISQIATTTGEWGSSMDEEEMRQPLVGEVSLRGERSWLAGWLAGWLGGWLAGWLAAGEN